MLVQQCVHERFRIERRQVVRAFTQADELDGNAELLLDSDHDTALCGAVELGQHDTGDVHDIAEDLRLNHTVLAGGRVNHEQNLGDRRFLLNHALAPHVRATSLYKSRPSKCSILTHLYLWFNGRMNESLHYNINQLSSRQVKRVERLVNALLKGAEISGNPKSSFANSEFLTAFGDLLIAHNTGSDIPLTKDKFEYALVDALNESGHEAYKVPNGNPGEDIIVNGIPWSLKTQADKNIKEDRLHISKFMELGKGRWETTEDIAALRKSMYNHMEAYDRIFSLRCFPRLQNKEGNTVYRYELVEIPKQILLLSKDFPIEIMEKSKQSPKPAYCRVLNDIGKEIYSLYFDGGTERKLQVKNIDKNSCIIHGTWRFTVEQ